MSISYVIPPPYFAMRHQFRKINVTTYRDHFNFAREMSVLNDEEPVNVVANATHDTTQLGHSPLSRPTTATVS